MPTYWDAFIEDFPNALRFPLPVILEAFYRYIDSKERAEKVFTDNQPAEGPTREGETDEKARA
jgi:hypothetical protein